MQKVISISEELKNETDSKGLTVHATADAEYDDEKGEVAVRLQLSPALVAEKVVRVSAPVEEASDVARDVFHSWIRLLVKQEIVSIIRG